MLIRHTGFYLLARGIPAVIAFLSLVLYTRLLTPEQYGLYAMVFSAMNIVNAIFFQWLNLSFGRFYMMFDDHGASLFSVTLRAFYWLLGITAVGTVVVVSVRQFAVPNLYVWAALTLAWAQAWFDLNLKIANVRLSPLHYGMLSISKNVLSLGMGLGLFYFVGFDGLFAGIATGTVITTAVLSRRNWGETLRFPKADYALLRRLLGYGLPIASSAVLILVVDVSDRFFIAWYLGAESVGLYSATYDLVQQGIGMPAIIIGLAALPLIVHALEKEGVVAAQQRLKEKAALLLLVTIPIIVSFSMLAHNIAQVVLGEKFRAVSKDLMPIISLGIFLGCMKMYYYDLSFQLGRKTLGLIWAGVAALVNVGLNILWVPVFGIMGAAYATLCAFAMAVFLSRLMGRRLFPLPSLVQEGYKIVLAAGGMALAYSAIAKWTGLWALVGQLVIGYLVYGFFIIFLDVGKCREKIFFYLGGGANGEKI